MRQLRLAVCAICLLIWVSPLHALAATPALSASQLAAAIAERAAYGLPSDEASIARALETGIDEAWAEWGMVLTSQELASLDMDGRVAFEGAAEERLLPYARSLANFAGAYFDQANGDTLTIMLTTMEGASRIMQLAPVGPHVVKIQLAVHTYVELKDAVMKGSEMWAQAMPDVELLSLAIDSRGNGLRAEVYSEDLASARLHVGEISSALGVGVTVSSGVRHDFMTCTDRSHCSNPLRDGIWINSSRESCTLGFWVRNYYGDEQIVDAGHCSYDPSTRDVWSTSYYGTIGQELINWEANYSYDMMVIAAPDDQATNMIYGESRRIIAMGYPTTGESVCRSGARSNNVDCGTITDDFHSYWGCGDFACYLLFGASFSGIGILSGDSGAPMYHRLSSPSATVLGVVSTGQEMTLTTGVLLNNGYSVVSS